MDPQAWADRCRKIEAVARTPRCDLLLRYFDIRQATHVLDARWQPFQIDWLNCKSILAAMNKGRQIGASFTSSADSMAECVLLPHQTVITISFNLEEAKEKIRYVKDWWESRNPEPWLVPARGEFDSQGNWLGKSPNRITNWPEVVKSNTLEVQWSNGSRFISHPCRPPRGKKASVLLDEFAHYQHDVAIFQAALPMITRGRGANRLSALSTPKGAVGKFWEIVTDVEHYPDWDRFSFGWWQIEDLCPREFRLACQRDFEMGVHQRELIERYGTKHEGGALWLWNNTNPKEDFYQEYGLTFLDSVYSYLSWALIKSCHPKMWDDREDSLSPDEQEDLAQQSIDAGYQNQYLHEVVRCEALDPEGIQPALDAIETIRRAKLPGEWAWGYDCGRDNDAAEITLFQVYNGRARQRLQITMAQISFPKQRLVIQRLLESFHMSAGKMDKGSVGREIGEWAETTWGTEQAEPVWFTVESKDKWAKNLKKLMEAHQIVLIPNKEQDDQLHSIQREAQGKIFVYKVGSDTVDVKGKRIKHHADKFWSIALAASAASKILNQGVVELVATDEHRQVETAYATLLRSPIRSGRGSRAREAINKVRAAM